MIVILCIKFKFFQNSEWLRYTQSSLFKPKYPDKQRRAISSTTFSNPMK